MHDFLLAKEIVERALAEAKTNNLENVTRVVLEIGSISMAHDGFDEHTEDISVDNLKFGLSAISKGTILEKASFEVSKVAGGHWRLVSVG